jgi:hypothetical protein
MRDVGHPIATQYQCRWILGRACGLGVGRKHKGRPARYVRRGAIIGSPTCSNFHSVYMLTLKTCTALSRTPHPAVRAATTSLAYKNKPEVNVHGLSMLFPPPTPHLPARCGHSWRFGAVHASSTLAHKTELEVVSNKWSFRQCNSLWAIGKCLRKLRPYAPLHRF